jgi:NTP-dependent ternary system trypsin peptidase co-occuring protein
LIELASVVRDLRAELGAAIVAGKDEQLRFELGPIEVEATVVVDRSADFEGKVRFWVVELGADRKTDSTSTLRISLSLTPKLAGISQPPWIAGQAESGES